MNLTVLGQSKAWTIAANVKSFGKGLKDSKDSIVSKGLSKDHAKLTERAGSLDDRAAIQIT